MSQITELDSFLSRNHITAETWKLCAIEWNVLQEIAKDHEQQLNLLRISAELCTQVIQGFQGVHSVRWRVKDTEHLLTKIIRKRAEGKEKYLEINSDNYFEIVTDLVGLRALHLFKDEWFTIDQQLREAWKPIESPIAYVRAGDTQDLTDAFNKHGFEVKQHPAGYRSIHYVLSTQPLQRPVHAEIQVRTIFEEGWSEIDHRVRYPNFSDDQLVSYFLTIFNRLAGNADEMGTFVQGLSSKMKEFEDQLAKANQQKKEAFIAIENLLADLEKMKRQDAHTNAQLASVQQKFNKLKELNSLSNTLGDSHRIMENYIKSLNPKKEFINFTGPLSMSNALSVTKSSDSQGLVLGSMPLVNQTIKSKK